MFKILLDIPPIPDEVFTEGEEIIIENEDIITNSIGGPSLTLIIGAILATLIAIGICLLLVRQVRKKSEHGIHSLQARTVAE